MERRALVPIMLGLLCFAVGLYLRAPMARGVLMAVAAAAMVYGVLQLSKSRR